MDYYINHEIYSIPHYPDRNFLYKLALLGKICVFDNYDIIINN